jgi:hypothetical protein
MSVSNENGRGSFYQNGAGYDLFLEAQRSHSEKPLPFRHDASSQDTGPFTGATTAVRVIISTIQAKKFL